MRFGKPLDFSRYEGLENDRYILRSITDEIMYEIMRLSGQEYVDMYATRAKALDKEGRRRATRTRPAAAGVRGRRSSRRPDAGRVHWLLVDGAGEGLESRTGAMVALRRAGRGAGIRHSPMVVCLRRGRGAGIGHRSVGCPATGRSGLRRAPINSAPITQPRRRRCTPRLAFPV